MGGIPLTTQKKIDQTWKYCIEMFGLDRCIALCLHGSQNYKLDLPDSDIDAKLIITPTWDEVINCREPKSQTIKGLYGDINVTDVRLFIGVNLKKQNFNFLETLFTPYSRVNLSYADLWGQLIEHREEIAHYDPAQVARTMLGQANNQLKRWGKFDDKKTLYNMMRISSALEQYRTSDYFADTLIPLNSDRIMKVRLGKVSQEDMEYMIKFYYDQAYYAAGANYEGPTYDTAFVIMDELQKKFVYRALYEGGIEE